MTRPVVPMARTAACVAVLAALGGCGGGGPSGTPAEVLADAQAALDGTSGVTLTLHADQLPDGVDGVLDAKGVATHAPAFEGDLTVVIDGLDVDVPVVAVDGKVYAELPFTSTFVEVNPADYGAPDPARLLDPDHGIPSWLGSATGVEKGDRVREAGTVLTSYDGTLAGDVVDGSIPSADEHGSFPISFRVDDDGQLRSVRISGPFYGADGHVDYTVGITDYGTEKQIEAP